MTKPLDGWKPDWAERIQRGRTKAFGKGYLAGVQNERERIINELIKDAVVCTNVDVKILERIVEIVEG